MPGCEMPDEELQALCLLAEETGRADMLLEFARRKGGDRLGCQRSYNFV